MSLTLKNLMFDRAQKSIEFSLGISPTSNLFLLRGSGSTKPSPFELMVYINIQGYHTIKYDICQIFLANSVFFCYSLIGDFLKRYIKHDIVRLEYYETLPSTNTALKEKALNGEKEGLVIIAGNQTAGRGRFNRKFYSPSVSGIYMSILLRPKTSGFDTTLLTTAAAVSVAKSAENLSGKKTQIKWVNDVLIEGKKICGILTEGAINPKTATPDYIVLGIGVNAFTPENGFDKEIENIATSVFSTPDPDLKARLTAEIINTFFDIYKDLESKNFLDEYKSRSAVIGKEINVIKNSTVVSAKALDIDDKCRLLVEYGDKTREFLQSGEISIKIKE